jgi:LysM domain
MQRSPRDLIRGLVALATTVGLLFGVPFLLARYGGWPLPRTMPTIGGISKGLTKELRVIYVVKALLFVCWMAWMALAWSLLSELAALRSGRTPRPRRSLAPFQQFAGRLVAGITLLVSMSSSATTMASAAPLPVRSEPVVLVQAAPAPVATVLQSDDGPTPVVAVAEGSVMVQPRDTLHRLAEVHLGDAMRWRDIWDLNRDQTMVDGTTFSRPEIIRPGWVLQLPFASVAKIAAVSPTTITVAPGDDLSGLAAAYLGDEAKWPDLFEANKGRSFGEVTFNQPDMIMPGWELNLPTPAAPEEIIEVVTPTPAAPPSVVAPVFPAPVVVAEPDVSVVDESVGDAASAGAMAFGTAHVAPVSVPSPATSPSIPTTAANPRDDQTTDWTIARTATGLAGATLLTTGIALTLANRRRRRLRSMGINHRLPLPHPDSAAEAEAVRLSADASMVTRIDLALRALAATVGAVGKVNASVVFDSAADISWRPELPQPLAVLVRPTGDIDLILDRLFVALTAPFVATDDASILRLPAAVPTADLAWVGATMPSPCPTLTMIGTTSVGEGDADLYLNLEALGGLRIAGERSQADDILRAITASLAVSPLGDRSQVFVCGLSLESFADATNLELSTDVPVAIREALALTIGRRQAEPDVAGFVLRATQPEDAWEVAVVIATDGGEDLANAAAASGVVVVTSSPAASLATTLVATADGWLLSPFNMVVTPVALTSVTLAGVAALLDDASAPPELLPAPIQSPAVDPFVERDWNFLVRVLGPVDVMSRNNEEVAFERAKALELVVWLSQHRLNPARISARTALWQVNVQDATFANVVSDARRSLARSLPPVDGHDWIARNMADRIPLHESVLTDVELVEARLAWARNTEGPAAIDVLLQAVELLRDQPYAGADYLWPDEDALPSGLTHLATSTTTELAQRCLDAGDIEGVFSATATGLRILPGHDELVCLRMQAHHRLGSTAGVRSEYAAYERVILSDGGGESDPSPRVSRMRSQLLAVAAGGELNLGTPPHGVVAA